MVFADNSIRLCWVGLGCWRMKRIVGMSGINVSICYEFDTFISNWWRFRDNCWHLEAHLRHIALNCDEWRQIEWLMNEIETSCVELVMSLRRVGRIEDDFRVAGAMTGRLRQIEASSSSWVECEEWEMGELSRNGQESGFEIGLDAF